MFRFVSRVNLASWPPMLGGVLLSLGLAAVAGAAPPPGDSPPPGRAGYESGESADEAAARRAEASTQKLYARLDRAFELAADGRLDSAIALMSTTINDRDLQVLDRRTALSRRAEFYIRRNAPGDIELAAADAHAAYDTLYMRTRADVDVKRGLAVVGRLKRDTTVYVMKAKDGWLWVEADGPNGRVEGYIKPNFVEALPEPEVEYGAPASEVGGAPSIPAGPAGELGTPGSTPERRSIRAESAKGAGARSSGAAQSTQGREKDAPRRDGEQPVNFKEEKDTAAPSTDVPPP